MTNLHEYFAEVLMELVPISDLEVAASFEQEFELRLGDFENHLAHRSLRDFDGGVEALLKLIGLVRTCVTNGYGELEVDVVVDRLWRLVLELVDGTGLGRYLLQ